MLLTFSKNLWNQIYNIKILENLYCYQALCYKFRIYNIKLRCQYRRYWTLGQRPQASRRCSLFLFNMKNVLQYYICKVLCGTYVPLKCATTMECFNTMFARFCVVHTFPRNVQLSWNALILSLQGFVWYIRSLKMCN